MRTMRRLAWAAALAALVGGPAFGQTLGGTTAGGTTGGLGGLGGTQGGGLGGTQGGGLGGTQGGQGGTTLLQQQAAPTLTGTSTTGSTNTVINQSNFLRDTYANPLYPGRAGAPTTQAATYGGFGSPTYTATGTSGTTGRGGVGTTVAGAGGRAGGLGGLGGANSGQDPGGVVVPLPRQIAYSAQIQFKAPVAPPGAMAADIRGTLDRSTMIANPRGVDVQVGDGGVVTLRGRVADGDEARLVEGMIRLTPGVREIKNELDFPR